MLLAAALGDAVSSLVASGDVVSLRGSDSTFLVLRSALRLPTLVSSFPPSYVWVRARMDPPPPALHMPYACSCPVQ